MNPYYSNKRIALIYFDEKVSQGVQQAAEALKKENAKVYASDYTNLYAGLYTMSESNPQLTIMVDSGSAKLVPVKAENASRSKKRNWSESQKAKEAFVHFMRMKGESPDLLGSYKLNWDDIKDIDWFVEDKSPIVYLRTNLDAAGIEYVIFNGVKQYFADCYKRQSEAEKKAEKESKNCCGLKGAVDRG